MEKTITLTPEQIPASFARCFDSACPQADKCVRYLAGKYTPDKCQAGLAVYPNARKGEHCTLYKETRIIRAAYGFKALFAEVKQKDDTPLRRRIQTYLGGMTTYYRYHHGERMLTPEQQEWIFALFRKHGYTENLRFDGYSERYDFTLG